MPAATKFAMVRQRIHITPIRGLGVIPDTANNFLEMARAPEAPLDHFPSGSGVVGVRATAPDSSDKRYHGMFQLPRDVDRDNRLRISVVFLNGTAAVSGGSAGDQLRWDFFWTIIRGTVDGIDTDDTDLTLTPDETLDVNIPVYTLPTGAADGSLHRTGQGIISGNRMLTDGVVSGLDYSIRDLFVFVIDTVPLLDNLSTTILSVEFEYTPKFYKARITEAPAYQDGN